MIFPLDQCYVNSIYFSFTKMKSGIMWFKFHDLDVETFFPTWGKVTKYDIELKPNVKRWLEDHSISYTLSLDGIEMDDRDALLFKLRWHNVSSL